MPIKRRVFEDKLVQIVISDGYHKAYFKASEYSMFLEDLRGWINPCVSFQYVTPEGETYWERQN